MDLACICTGRGAYIWGFTVYKQFPINLPTVLGFQHKFCFVNKVCKSVGCHPMPQAPPPLPGMPLHFPNCYKIL